MVLFELRAQTMEEIVQQVAAGLRSGCAVELDNRYRYCPVNWLPTGYIARLAEDIAALGVRVDDAWLSVGGRR